MNNAKLNYTNKYFYDTDFSYNFENLKLKTYHNDKS